MQSFFMWTKINLSRLQVFAVWFKQYSIYSFTCKQIYTTSNVPGSVGKLEAYTGHFLVDAQFELRLHWVHMSEGTLSYVEAKSMAYGLSNARVNETISANLLKHDKEEIAIVFEDRLRSTITKGKRSHQS